MYNELSKVNVTNKRTVVISKCSKGGYTIAQKVEIEEGKRKANVFMKGAVIVESLDKLIELRNALDIAIKAEKQWKKFEETTKDWSK